MGTRVLIALAALIACGGARAAGTLPYCPSTNTQSGLTYTIAAGDANNCVLMTDATPPTVTINANTVAVGAMVTIQQGGAPVTIVAGSGVIFQNVPKPATVALATRGPQTFVSLYQQSANTWVLLTIANQLAIEFSSSATSIPILRAYNGSQATQSNSGQMFRADGNSSLELSANQSDTYTGPCPLPPDTTSGLNGSCLFLSAGSDGWFAGSQNMSFNVATLNQAATSQVEFFLYNGESDNLEMLLQDESSTGHCGGDANYPNAPCFYFSTTPIGSTNFPVYMGPDGNFALGMATIGLTTGVTETLNNTSSGSITYLQGQTPTLSGFGTSPGLQAGSVPSSMLVTVGTGGTASTGSVNLPAATHGWICFASDQSTPSTNATKQTSSSSTAAGFTNYNTTTGAATAWTAGDQLDISCFAH
jgi:hypothetical protein